VSTDRKAADNQTDSKIFRTFRPADPSPQGLKKGTLKARCTSNKVNSMTILNL